MRQHCGHRHAGNSTASQALLRLRPYNWKWVMRNFSFFVYIAITTSVLAASCGPNLNQQSTLVAMSIISTLTANAKSNVSSTPLPPTGTLTDTPTPKPPSTSTPNQTATVLSQIYATATVQAGWKPSLYDSFGSNIFEWCNDNSVSISDDGAKTRFFFDNGVYHMTYTAGEKYPQSFCGPHGNFYDFQVSVLAKLISGESETSYGVIFRTYHQSFKSLSRFIINPGNEYRIDTRDFNGNWTILQDWTKTNDMKPRGEWNKITISGIGTEFTFYINDRFQTRLIHDGAATEKGVIGFVVNSAAPRKSIDVLFDDLTVREP